MIEKSLLLAAALAIGCGSEPEPATLSGDDVLARVGDEDVTVGDYHTYLQRVPEGARNDLDPQRVVQAIVDEKLILSESRRLGLDRSFEYRDLVQRQTRRLSLGELYRRQGIVRRDPQEAELQAFFAASPYSRRVRFSLIMLRDLAGISSLQEQLSAGADFEEISLSHSQDPRILMRDADMGYHRWGETMPSHQALTEKAFTMSPGEIAGPLQVADGFFLIKVTDVHPVSLDQEREIATELWSQQQLARQLAVFCDTLAQRYSLTFDEDGVQALWSKVMSSPAAIADGQQVVVELSEGTLTVDACERLLQPQDRQVESVADLQRVLTRRLCREILMLQEIGRLDLVNSDEVKRGLVEVRRRVLLDLIKQRVVGQVPALHLSLVRMHYDVSRQDYHEPEQVVTRRLPVPDLETGQRIANQLRTGRDTASFVDGFVDVTYTAMNGDGPLAVALRSPPGSVHGPIAQDTGGLAVIQILERRSARVLDFEEVQERVAGDLLSQQHALAFEQFLADLREQHSATVQIFGDRVARLGHV